MNPELQVGCILIGSKEFIVSKTGINYVKLDEPYRVIEIMQQDSDFCEFKIRSITGRIQHFFLKSFQDHFKLRETKLNK